MAFDPLSSAFDLIKTGVDKIWPDADAESKRKYNEHMAQISATLELAKGQIETNKVEAAHKSIFVAGWRPSIGWICAVGLGYQFLVYPMLCWGWMLLQARQVVPLDLTTPPPLETGTILSLVTGMLGLGITRAAEKLKGVARDS